MLGDEEGTWLRLGDDDTDAVRVVVDVAEEPGLS